MSFFLSFFLFNVCHFLPLEMQPHDFHLSKCDIIYSADEKAIQISLQLFIDDLEVALEAKGHENLGLCTPQETSEGEEVVFAYVKEHLHLNIDGERLDLNWVGKEVSDDLAGVWCYLEVHSKEPQKSIDVRNDLLVEIFADQRNIVKLVYKPELKAHFLFDKKDIEGTLKISK